MKISQKDLDKEGITKALIDAVLLDTIKEVQLEPEAEVSQLLRCTKGFWIMQEGKPIKNEKGLPIVISDKEAKIGSVRYKLNHKEALREKEIDKEVANIKNEIDTKLAERIKHYRNIISYSKRDADSKEDVDKILFRIVQGYEKEDAIINYQQKVKDAKEIVDEDFMKFFDYLQAQQGLDERKDYDSLYRLIVEENGMLTSFSYEKIYVAVKYFGVNNLDATMENLSQDYIRTVASINVDKRMQVV